MLMFLKTICRLNWKIDGMEHFPNMAVLVAAKHQSAWDTIVMPLLFPGAAVVLKRELTWIPFYGWYIRKYGTIPIERNRGVSALRKMRQAARTHCEGGKSVIIFPEGTRAEPGAPIALQSGVAALYKDLNIFVLPIALNSGRFWGRRTITRQPGTITVKILPPIPPGLTKQEFLSQLGQDINEAQASLNPSG